MPFDSRPLEKELLAKLKGEVRFDDGSRGLYATDASNYRQVPIGVVIPKNRDDIIETVAACHRHGAPILSRGGGTSLAGQTCNVAVVMDMSKYYNQILELNPDAKFARVEPGVVLDTVRDAAEKHRLTFGPDPATHNHCTLGGMIGNNSCGTHSIMAGKTVENVESLTVLTYDGLILEVGPTPEDELKAIITAGGRRGEIYAGLKSLRDRYQNLIRARYPDIPRRVSGYNLDQLLPENGFNVARALVGTESTCVTVLEAKLRLIPNPRHKSLLVVGFPDVFSSGDHVPDILKFGPIALEAVDDRLESHARAKHMHVDALDKLPKGNSWLFVEFGADSPEEAKDKAERLERHLRHQSKPLESELLTQPEEQKKLWSVREAGLGATARVPGQKRDTWEGWEDSAVPPDKVGAYLRDLRALLDKYNYKCALYGHFGQGCIHTRIEFDFLTAEGIEIYMSFMDEATDLVLKYGGSFSGEHGDGQSKAQFLPKMYGPELITAFEEFKSLWDPQWKMNPGKIVRPYKINENLRLGTHYNPPELETYFKFPDDRGSLSFANLRCVGVGQCRRTDAGTMCPSYMVTKEEKHSTRGRARMLFEMLQGEVVRDGWRSKEVKDALDLCLACKGCKGDCPVNVDMATYKAEFLAHFHERRIRPASAYAMGFINVWAGIASKAPWLVNFFTHAPLLGRLFKAMGGIAQAREVPRFAPQTFREWYARQPAQDSSRPRVILWCDTFTNHFSPEIAQDAYVVLRAAGFHVAIPEKILCCGRPLYDFGMLKQAKAYLERVLATLREDIAAGTPVIGLEPSCTAVFKDEIKNLFPNNEDAKRLTQQTYLFGDFLMKRAKDFPFRNLNHGAILHGHCHQKAVLKHAGNADFLKRLGVDVNELDAGCCGMAGSFGFEKNHYGVSMQIGERALLPAVRQASTDTWVIADGFSCREQVIQATGRKPLHIAQVARMALPAERTEEQNATRRIRKENLGDPRGIHPDVEPRP